MVPIYLKSESSSSSEDNISFLSDNENEYDQESDEQIDSSSKPDGQKKP